MEIRIPVSAGEIIDKLTILEIKEMHIRDSAKLANILREKKHLEQILISQIPPSEKLTTLRAELKAVNEKLWGVEDRLRQFERTHEFGPFFVEDARAVYFTNDLRAEIKRKINELLSS